MKIENIIHKLGIQLNEMQQAAMEAMLNGKDNMIVAYRLWKDPVLSIASDTVARCPIR